MGNEPFWVLTTKEEEETGTSIRRKIARCSIDKNNGEDYCTRNRLLYLPTVPFNSLFTNRILANVPRTITIINR